MVAQLNVLETLRDTDHSGDFLIAVMIHFRPSSADAHGVADSIGHGYVLGFGRGVY
jgi:hypothetical protein